MDLDLKGKNVVVLGGTRGIGRAIAETFADEGANVAICARDAQQVSDAVSEMSAKSVKVLGKSVDVTDGAAVKQWIASVADDLAGIDILISNAGAMTPGFEVDAWEKNFRLDILGATSAFEAAHPFLKSAAAKNGDAAFIVVGSIASAVATHGGSYGAIKAALTHMAKGLALEHAQDHIRVNTVSPGMTDFPGSTWEQLKVNVPEMYEDVRRSVRLGHSATPQNIADAVVFLSSPRSYFTTGANLLIDGGQSERVHL